MKEKNIIPGWLSLVLLAVGVGTVAYNLMGMTTNPGVIGFFNYLFYSIASVSFVVYCVYGYQKKVAETYTITAVTFAFAQLVAIINAANSKDYISLALLAISFACLCVLAIGKDLGKENSLFIVFSVAALSVANLIYQAVTVGLGVGSGDLVTGVIISLVFILMVFAKYSDKASRGSK